MAPICAWRETPPLGEILKARNFSRRGEHRSARLEQFRDVFAFVEREVPAVIDRFLREGAGRTGVRAGRTGGKE